MKSLLYQKLFQIYKGNKGKTMRYIIRHTKMMNFHKFKFSSYKDVVSFDLTYNLIKNTHISTQKWKVGCLLGVSLTKKIAPLALIITLFETK